MMKRLLLVSCAAALVMTPLFARAQDSGSFNRWTGWRAGLQLGMNSNSYDGYESSSTFTTGMEIGYDFRLNRHLVLGGNLYSEWNNDTNHKLSSFPVLNVNYGSRAYGVDGLIGFPVNNFLPYVKLGYGHVSITGDLYGSDNSMRYGVGLFMRLDSHSALAVQYMYQKASIPNVMGNGDFKNGNLTVGYNWFFN